MKSGTFRRKTNFAAVSNSALKDKRLSLKAKGLYSLIQSYITMPNITLSKSKLHDLCLEGEKAFDGAWKELKKCGYLKIYRSPTGDKDQFVYEYDLLDEADDSSPAFLTLNKHGEVAPPKDSNEEIPSHTPKKEVCETETLSAESDAEPDEVHNFGNSENWHIPQNGGYANFDDAPYEMDAPHPPHFAPYAEGTPCEAHPVPNGGNKNKTKAHKTHDHKTLKSVSQSIEDGQTDIIREKLKEQIDYDYFEEANPNDLAGVNVLIDCMTDILLSPTTRVGGFNQDRDALKPYISKVDSETIRGFLEHMKNRPMRNVRNVNAYWKSALIDFIRARELTMLTV